MTKDGVPILGIEKKASDITIAHEMEHFYDWLGIKYEFIEEGYDENEASQKAFQYLSSSPQQIINTEFNAVMAEWSVKHPSLWDTDFISRSVYPEIAAIQKSLLNPHRLRTKKRVELNNLMDQIIERALSIRKARLAEATNELNTQGVRLLRVRKLNKLIEQAKNIESLITEIIPPSEWTQIIEKYGKVKNDVLTVRGLFEERLPAVLSRLTPN